MNDLVNLGKFISLILRHKPELIGLKLDYHGWAKVDELLLGINKQRYQYNEDHTKIRANQGHSIKVDIELIEKIPPEYLYHGTAFKYLNKIEQEGIKKMKRLYVHLSKDIETAFKVGSRHGKAIVLVIDTKAMCEDGCKFYYSQNGVWLTEDIDYKYVMEVIK